MVNEPSVFAPLKFYCIDIKLQWDIRQWITKLESDIQFMSTKGHGQCSIKTVHNINIFN